MTPTVITTFPSPLPRRHLSAVFRSRLDKESNAGIMSVSEITPLVEEKRRRKKKRGSFWMGDKVGLAQGKARGSGKTVRFSQKNNE